MSDTRFVPMTKEQRYTMSRWNRQLADNLVAAFDAAPADPAEAIDNAVFDAEGASDVAPLVLRALGYPDPDASEPRA